MDAFSTLRHPHGQRPPRTYRRRGPHLRNGECAAAQRADTAARILLKLPITANSLAAAAHVCDLNVQYVAAAITLIESGDAALMALVRRGHVSLLDAAAIVKKQVALLRAYREASPADRVALARTIGPTVVFDNVVSPALN